MKKLTTTMMQETLNKHDAHLTVGLDLGDRSSFYCVLDGTGDVLLEQKVSTTPKAISDDFRSDASMSCRSGDRNAFPLGEPTAQ
jgi:transposase